MPRPNARQRFSYWLRQRRGLACLKVQTPMGERLLKFDPHGHRPWATAAVDCKNLNATAVEALDDHGQILGTFSFTDDGEEDAAQAAIDREGDIEAEPEAAVANPIVPFDLGAHLNLVSKLLSQAHTTSFDKLVQIVELSTTRQASLEKQNQQLLTMWMRSQIQTTRSRVKSEPEEEEAGGMNGMLAAVLQGALASKMGGGPMAQAVASAATHPPTNGTRVTPHVVDAPVPDDEPDDDGEDDDEAKE
jgi:hypothetical protein